MTLIIAGFTDSRRLFFASDSTISDGNRTLLNGFQKVYEVPVIVHEPYFIVNHFQRYLPSRKHTHCAIAFAGSTLTAQHVLNSITSELGSLFFGQDAVGKYGILRRDEYNELIKQSRVQLWAEDMFLPEDMTGLLTGKVIADAVAHAVQKAVESARRYAIDEQGFKKLENQYAVGTYSPDSDEVSLYEIDVVRSVSEDGMLVPLVKIKEVCQSEISVLGLRERFKTEAETALHQAHQQAETSASALFRFLNSAIERIWTEGSRVIDRPAYLYEFSATGLTEQEVSGPGCGAA